MICKTIKRFCCEDISKIENYEKAINDKEMWYCHHKLELIATGGVCDVDRQDLIDWGIYYNRPADELIFLTRADHLKLHLKDKPKSEETKKKLSDAMKGKKRPGKSNKGKRWKLVGNKHVWY